MQAYLRCQELTDKLPQLLFLHGNVSVGYCDSCNIAGLNNQTCNNCGNRFEKTKLLYPIENKNYSNDLFISEQWKVLKKYMQEAYSITIFGYGAPKTDTEAVSLMKEAWGLIEERNLEEIEIINILEEEELLETWKEFIHSHHYKIRKDFFDSYIALFPRRSVEAMWEMFMNCEFLDPNFKLKSNMSKAELTELIFELRSYENKANN